MGEFCLSTLWIFSIFFILLLCGCKAVHLYVRRLFGCHLAVLLVFTLSLQDVYCGTIGWSRVKYLCIRSHIWCGLKWMLLLICIGWRVNCFKIFLYLCPPCFLVRQICVWVPPFCRLLWLHLCVLLFWFCGSLINVFFLIHRTNGDFILFYLLILVLLVSQWPSPVCVQIYEFLADGGVGLSFGWYGLSVSYGYVGEVCNFSSKSFSFWVSPFDMCMALSAWYLSVFGLDWYSQRYWWAVVKSVLKVSHFFLIMVSFSKFFIRHWRCQLFWVVGCWPGSRIVYRIL